MEGQDSGHGAEGVARCKVRPRQFSDLGQCNMSYAVSLIPRSKKVETRDGGHVFDQGIQGSLNSWNKLPKAPDQEVILLKKARGGNGM